MQSDSESVAESNMVKKPQKKVWHRQQEMILKRWSEIGSSYRFMHDRSYTKFEKQNLRFALPVIIISTVTGTANFAQGSFPPEWNTYVPLFIGFLNLTAGLLTTVAQFLRVSELLEGHRAAAIAYSKFSRNVSVELSLPREERTCGGTEFVTSCRAELDRLIESTPNIPLEIIRAFGKKFEADEHTFTKPAILTITEVEIFKDEKKKRRQEKLEALKYEEELRRELMETEKLRRAEFIEELAKKRELDQKLESEKKKLRRQEKKNNVNAGAVENSMKKLLERLQSAQEKNTVITPQSSADEKSPVISPTGSVSGNIVLDIKEPTVVEEDTVVDPVTNDGDDPVTNDGDDPVGGESGNEDDDEGDGGDGGDDGPTE